MLQLGGSSSLAGPVRTTGELHAPAASDVLDIPDDRGPNGLVVKDGRTDDVATAEIVTADSNTVDAVQEKKSPEASIVDLDRSGNQQRPYTGSTRGAGIGPETWKMMQSKAKSKARKKYMEDIKGAAALDEAGAGTFEPEESLSSGTQQDID